MEKKVYPKPVTRVIELELCGMLAGSDPKRDVPKWDGEGD